jgi:hypothetical protein
MNQQATTPQGEDAVERGNDLAERPFWLITARWNPMLRCFYAALDSDSSESDSATDSATVWSP